MSTVTRAGPFDRNGNAFCPRGIAELENILAANRISVKFGTGVAAVQNVYADAALAKATVTA
jgi:hypothetical protein